MESFNTNGTVKKRHLIHLEGMRILAAFFVIFNHTGENGFFLFSKYSPDMLQFWCYLVVSIFCKFSVGLFLMISGALLLENEEESIGQVWRRRIRRLFITLVFFSFLYYLLQVYQENEAVNLKKFVFQLYKSNWNFSYGYLYTYLAFLISLPLLRKFVSALEDRHYYYIIGLTLFFQGIQPIVEYLLWKGGISLNAKVRVGWIMELFVLYPCLGYYLEHKCNIKRVEKRLLALWGINFLCIGISCYMTYYKAMITGECSESASQAFHQSFTMVNCIVIYISVKALFQKFVYPQTIKKLIVSVGSCTFGIYLLHMGIIWMLGPEIVSKLWDLFQNQWRINHMLSAFLFCLLIMTIGYLLTLLIKKIPVLKNLV